MGHGIGGVDDSVVGVRHFANLESHGGDMRKGGGWLNSSPRSHPSQMQHALTIASQAPLVNGLLSLSVDALPGMERAGCAPVLVVSVLLAAIADGQR